ncbi:hypothetical protein DP43_5607 [Burkholderia pseudomallei]|nr:hypothetical protein DP43_5607 [Burkholderia pseudomallei]
MRAVASGSSAVAPLAGSGAAPAAAAPAAAAGSLSSSRSHVLKPYFAKISRSASRPSPSVASDASNDSTCGASSQPVSTVTSLRASGRKSSARRRLSPTTPLISPACSTTPSSEPYCVSHLTAVFGPHFSTPGTLSTVSPMSDR